MKYIHDKLKKLSYFDVILSIVVLFGIIIFAFIFFRKPTYVNVTVKIGEDEVAFPRAGSRNWFAQLFYKGMKETDGLGNPIAEVTDVFVYDTELNKQAIYLTLKIKALYTKSKKQYSYQGKPILIGYPIRLQIGQINATGITTGIEGVRKPGEDVTLLVDARLIYESNYLETSGSLNFIGQAVNVGDIVTDSHGDTVIKVLNKKSEPAKKAVTTATGNVLIKTNPLLSDVYLKLLVNARKVNGKYFLFDDIPVLINQRIPINTSFVSIGPLVTHIEETTN